MSIDNGCGSHNNGAVPKANLPADLLSTAEVATLLDLERSTVVRWAQIGKLRPAMKVAGATGTYLFRREDVEAMRSEAHPRSKKAS